ncbi:hypothetical protein KCU93_g7634, partial [Aureobasidium melanogenum]
MDDKHLISGKYSNPSVFNNSQDSDIILKCGTERFYAHRAILRLWSPFFARSLNSEFPVAKSAVFEIDDDDYAAHEPFCAVLKHMYGMTFGEHPENDDCHYINSLTAFEHSIRVYMAADKYDVPSARLAAVSSAESHLEEPDPSNISEWIAIICGPEAPRLADTKLRNALFSWLSANFYSLVENPDYKEKIENGSLLDTELNAKLLFTLSAQAAPRKKRRVM